MKKFRLFTLLLASVATLAFCGCGEDNGPAIKHEVSRMNHFARLDISSDMLAIADVVCECTNIYGETKSYEFYGTNTILIDDTWRPNSGVEEPKQVTITLKATPRGDSETTTSTLLLDASIQTEFTVYNQNDKVIGYNGLEKGLSKRVEAGTNIKSFLGSNFPVTYSFVITKGDDGMYGVQAQ